MSIFFNSNRLQQEKVILNSKISIYIVYILPDCSFSQVENSLGFIPPCLSEIYGTNHAQSARETSDR